MSDAAVEVLRTTLAEMADKAKNAALQTRALHERIQQGELSTAQGVSFLEVPYRLTHVVEHPPRGP